MLAKDWDRERLAYEQGYEVYFLVKRTGIAAEQARELIKHHGNDRATLVREAQKLKIKVVTRAS